jgi:hypothetical protein
MALQAPKASDLFGDATSAKDAALRKEEFDAALTKSVGQSVTDPSAVMSIKSGSTTFAQASGDPIAQMEALVANKSISADVAAGLQNALATQRSVMGEINKEITLTSPLASSFAAFDLEAPAKLLTPRPTPLRNKLPRKKGIGTSHRVKRILGYTGTGTGGVGNIWPGITQSTTTAFGSINYERGPQIQYAADDLVLPYNSYSLSDAVSWDAQFSGVGFEDLRQLSSTSTLYATMLMEERMLLMARGTAAGYSGLLGTPVQPTGVNTVATSGQSAITGAAAKLFAIVTADAGSFGESAPSVASAAITVNAGDVVTITIPTAISGALGYNVYIGTAASTAPADSAFYYAGRTATQTFVVQGALPTTTTTVATVKTQQLAGNDLSAYATGYDGILPTVLGPNTGFNNRINSTFSTSNPGVEYQNAFSAMYDAVKADPDEIFLNGADRKQLSDAIKNGSTANYRLNLTQTEAGDYVGGATIGALYNEITGKMVPLTVHPWLPQGVSPILSYTLPIPDTQVSDVWSNFLVQDYMGVQWPVSQFQYEFSTYFRGTFMCQAPAWNGAVSGIAAA